MKYIFIKKIWGICIDISFVGLTFLCVCYSCGY